MINPDRGVFVEEDVVLEPEPGTDGAGIGQHPKTALGYSDEGEPPSNSGVGFTAPEYEQDPQYKAAADYLLGLVNGTIEAKYYEYPNMEEVGDFQARFGDYSFATLQLKQVLTAPEITDFVKDRTPTIPNIILERLLVGRVRNRNALRPSYRREYTVALMEQMAEEMGVPIESLESLEPPFVIDKVLKGQLVVYTPKEGI